MHLAQVVTMPNTRPRTSREIAAELLKMDALRDCISALSPNGELLLEAFHAQERVLEDRLGTEDVCELYDDGRTHMNTLSEALNAVEWLAGEDGAPSEGWGYLLGPGPVRAWVN